MSINGIDVTAQFSALCGAIWFVFYASFVYLVIRFRPQNIKQRRWKASLLIGGLPVLGMPLLMPIILLIISFFSVDISKANFSTLAKNLPSLLADFISLALCVIPFSAFMALFATIGSYSRFVGSDKWLNTIVRPSKDEKTDIHDWY